MSKRRAAIRSHPTTTNPKTQAAPWPADGLVSASDVNVGRPGVRWPVLIVLLLALIGVGGVLIARHQATTSNNPAPPTAAAEVPAPPFRPDPEQERLCRRFMELKNQNDPAAGELLGPAPVVPIEPVSSEEVRRLDAEIFLRRNCKVVSVRPGSQPGQFLIALQGSVDSERIPFNGPNGPDVSFRSVYNPDVVVEVREGKIHGVRAQLHEDPGDRPMSPRNAEAVRRMLGVTPDPRRH
jgi:hypothetical protein